MVENNEIITFIPFNNGLKHLSNIKNIDNEKELSYRYNGKSYIKYPIGLNKGVLSVSNDNLVGFIVSSKRDLRMQNKELKRASLGKVKDSSDAYVNEFIKQLNKQL